MILQGFLQPQSLRPGGDLVRCVRHVVSGDGQPVAAYLRIRLELRYGVHCVRKAATAVHGKGNDGLPGKIIFL